jgi:hypothetical protein
MASSNNSRWSAADDAKLSQLFRIGKLNPKETDNQGIHKALKYWPAKKYEAFAVLYKRKCSKWNLEQNLAGARGVAGEWKCCEVSVY